MKKEILSWIGCFAVAIAAALFIVTFIGQRVEVDGRSMEPTLEDKDNLICDKISYRFSEPERFDIVVIYPYEGSKQERWIKRIIGLPGEEVRIEPIQLGEDEYWVMGDNRNHSSDSRVIGPVTKDRIIGKAFVRIYPFSKIGFIKHQ